MKKIIYILSFLAMMGCSSGPKREIASKKAGQLSCLEKTTRKECTVNIAGEQTCSCVPDDGEMYRTYP